jgi:anthranilate phosphoribosyltransferase
MEGEATNAQSGSFLTALRLKGETSEEIASAASVMREKATRVQVPEGITVVDTCGTGGDGANTFNISTTSAFIAAGAGATVAKHGNRSVSSKCGSADVLQELEINTSIPAEKMAQCISQSGIGFLFAPMLHSAMKHVIEPRREIGIRTLFNILGPLSNPAFAHAQVLGVYHKNLVHTMAEVLKILEIPRALVVHGTDGLDEITLTGITYVTELKQGILSDWQIDPEELGLTLCSVEDVKGDTAEKNAAILTNILSCKERGAKRDISLLNAAAAIYVSGLAKGLKDALDLARHSLDSGSALKKLIQLIEVSNA